MQALDVSRETLDALKVYAAKVRKWNRAINLVSNASLETLEERHIADSLQLATLAPTNARHWADLGSGGGFPGLVIAIYGVELGWPKRITLVESDARKAVFLRETAREMGLTVEVLNVRAETLSPLGADIVSARAFAPLTDLCGHAYRHLAKEGTAIFPKGAGHAAEISDASTLWRFDIDAYPSKTDPNSRIIVLRNIQHAR